MTPDSAIHFLLWLLIVASVVAVVASRFRIPYAVALVIGGLVLGSIHRLPVIQSLAGGVRPNWLTPEVILILFLPPLIFEGSIRIRTRILRENLVPILLLANAGVLVATLITGFAVHWIFGLPVLVALLFGAIISATDPISVISVFEEMGVSKRLSVIVESESLVNDGTAVVLFGILLAGISGGRLSPLYGVEQFILMVVGATALGAILGYLVSKIASAIDEPTVEITLTTILAYGSYLAALSLHLSGVIATVAAGIVLGNYGTRVAMSPRTQMAMWSFWEYAAFVINSIVFLLIGMQVQIGDLLRSWHAVGLAVGAVLLGRILSVYGLTPLSNLVGERIPIRWQHILVWGGLRGALALALVLSLDPKFPHRAELLTWTFGVVAFSLIVQGLTIKPLLRWLGVTASAENSQDRTRARHVVLSAARQEVDEMLRTRAIPASLHARLGSALNTDIEQLDAELGAGSSGEAICAAEELDVALTRLLAAERNAIHRAIQDGLISAQSAQTMIDAAHRHIDNLSHKLAVDSAPASQSAADLRLLRKDKLVGND